MRFLRLASLVVICCVPVAAQSFSYASFAGATGIALNGNASIVPSTERLQLTSDVTNQAGQAYRANQVVVVAGFDTTFQFKVTRAATQGADGLAFIVQNSPQGTGTPSAPGGNIGYGFTSNALVVEFDMDPVASPWLDSGPNEISIHTNGNAPVSAAETASIGRVLAPAPFMWDQQVHTVRILYVPGTISVWLDNMAAPVLVRPYDFATGATFATSGLPVAGLNLPNGTAYVGFTSGTGSYLTQAHEVLNWTFSSTPAVINCETGNIGASTLPMPAQVLTVNASSGSYAHTLNVPVYTPLTIAYAPVPVTTATPFAIWCTFAPAASQIPLSTGFGDFCFLPPILDPLNPFLLTLTDNIGLGLPGLLPSAPGAWTFTLPASIQVPLSFRLQGAIIDVTGPQVMNAVTVHVVPLPTPAITSLTPLFGNAGTTVTINGTTFVAGCAVTFGGVVATITTQTATQIVTSVPAGVPCPGTLVVTNPDGQSTTRPFNQPIVTGSLFSTGPAAGGANFYIYGQGLAAPCTVTIGGSLATIITNSPSQIICTTPPGTIGAATVLITTAQGCTANTTYTYL